ncbi:MAG: hypothetical protein JWP44_4893 [Mucilaginibacter sp.]|nr:hypothetical protein [Mucilaginibacter sp.]
MTLRDPNAPGPLTREEREFWSEAYLATLRSVLGAAGQAGADRSMSGMVRAATEAAWASLDAFRMAAKGDRYRES